MKCFRYSDYLKYKKLIKINILNDQNEPYNYENKQSKITQPKDKNYKTILSNKIEAAALINDVLKLQIKPSQIEHYNGSFIFENYINRQAI